MSERKLATIQQIETLRPIEGADKIVKATMVGLGWECVVKKDEFNERDKIIYCEVDSVMPEEPEFEFLRERKFRIRTIKLKNQVSQGLILPLSSLKSSKLYSYEIGDDITDLMGITKHLTPSEREELYQNEIKLKNERNKLKKFMSRYSWFRKLFLNRKQKEGFPYWISKTDEERIQNIPQVLEQFKDKLVYVTEKIDYQSVTFTGKMIPRFTWLGKFSPKKYEFIVCSRNLTTNDLSSLYWRIAKKYNIEDILRKNPNLTIQGEQGNTNIQGNKYDIKEPEFWVFNIKDHEKNYFYDWCEMRSFCKSNGLQTVPILLNETNIKSETYCKLSELGSTVQEMVEFSKGKSTLSNIPREGVVIRCIEDGRKLLSFKVINPDFLLKYND